MDHPNKTKVCKALNEVLTIELTGINQFYLHARMLKNWGYERLAEATLARSIDEMKHAQLIVDRILYFDGLPNLQKLGPLRIGETVLEILNSDYDHEKVLVETLTKHINLMTELNDHGSRTMLEGLLTSEEEDIDWFEAQLTLVEQVGEDHYLAQQIKES